MRCRFDLSLVLVLACACSSGSDTMVMGPGTATDGGDTPAFPDSLLSSKRGASLSNLTDTDKESLCQARADLLDEVVPVRKDCLDTFLFETRHGGLPLDVATCDDFVADCEAEAQTRFSIEQDAVFRGQHCGDFVLLSDFEGCDLPLSRALQCLEDRARTVQRRAAGLTTCEAVVADPDAATPADGFAWEEKVQENTVSDACDELMASRGCSGIVDSSTI